MIALGLALVVFRDGSFADDSHYFVQRFGSGAAAACFLMATGLPVDEIPLKSPGAQPASSWRSQT